jgi:hypothetical protein
MTQDQTTTDTAAERAALIAASIDWDPTCLPGEEKQTIVRQVLRAAGLPVDCQARAQLAELRGCLHGLAEGVERRKAPIAPADVADMIREAVHLADAAAHTHLHGN